MSNKKLSVLALGLICSTSAFANETASSFDKWFSEGSVHGAMKSYYFAETFDKEGSHDSQIWANGGNIAFNTAELNGFELGGEFQGSYINSRNDRDGKTAGSMDADGAILSESYLKYTLGDTIFKGEDNIFHLLLSPILIRGSSRSRLKCIRSAIRVY